MRHPDIAPGMVVTGQEAEPESRTEEIIRQVHKDLGVRLFTI